MAKSIFKNVCMHVQSHLTLWDPMDCSPPGSSVRGILQAGILEWVAMPSSRDLPASLASPALQVVLYPLSHHGSPPKMYVCLYIYMFIYTYIYVVQSLSSVQFCNPMDYSTLSFPVLHCLLEFAQIHGRWVGDAIWPSHPLPPSSPLAFNLS